jgi:hypothetical protein
MNDRLSDLPSNKEERIRFFNDDSNWAPVETFPEYGIRIERLLFTNVVRISHLSAVEGGKAEYCDFAIAHVSDGGHPFFGPNVYPDQRLSQTVIDDWVKADLDKLKEKVK